MVHIESIAPRSRRDIEIHLPVGSVRLGLSNIHRNSCPAQHRAGNTVLSCPFLFDNTDIFCPVDKNDVIGDEVFIQAETAPHPRDKGLCAADKIVIHIVIQAAETEITIGKP